MRAVTFPLGLSLAFAGALAAAPASAATFFFSTGLPDGKIATLSRPANASQVETETADDFALTQATKLKSATFTGLITSTTAPGVITGVNVEIYRVFPQDSNVGRTSGPPLFSTPEVPTRVNSPSDVALTTADSGSGELTFTVQDLGSFSALNSVVNGINPKPGQFTGGDGAASGDENVFSVDLTTPIVLGPGHYFFVPQVAVDHGEFLWLSAPRPIVSPGTPFPLGFTDLQAWIRNENLAPDWLRVGTDITGQGPFNMAFTLNGNTVPEPGAWTMLIVGFAGVGSLLRRRPRANASA